MRPLLVFLVLALGCGGTTGPADKGPQSSSGGSSSGGTTSGGTTSGGTTSGGTTSGGTTSGGTTSGGTSGAGVTAAEICKIATIGFKGQWGDGNVFTDWLQSQSTQGTTALGGEILTPALLAPFQVIVVQDVRNSNSGQPGIGQGIGRAFTADEVAALRAWVEQGGGLMTLIGYAGPDEITNVNQLLEPFGLSYGSQQVLQGGGGVTVPVTQWATTHPIAAGITKIGVDNGYTVQGGGTLVAWEPTQGGQHDMGRSVDLGTGHVFAWGDEWITYNSEWTAKPEYQVAKLWANALTWLKGASRCQVPLPPGEW